MTHSNRRLFVCGSVVSLCSIASFGCASDADADADASQAAVAPVLASALEIAFEARPAYVPSNWLALTFDDGPDNVHTPAVLDVLKEKNVKATFFVNNNNERRSVDADPALQALVRRIVAEGHELGNHTSQHLHLHEQSAATVESEITAVQNTINRADVLGPDYPKLTLLRAPYGEPYQWPGPGSPAYNLVAPIVAKYAVEIGWAIDTFDYDCYRATPQLSKQCVFDNFKSKLDAGDYGIVLLHSIHPQTAAAIGDIIDYSRSRGMVFRKVEDFVGAKFGQLSQSLIYGECSRASYLAKSHVFPGQVEAEDFDVGGPECAYSDLTAANEGGAYRFGTSVDLEATQDVGGGHNVGWTSLGEWLKYSIRVAESGTYALTFRVAAERTVERAFHVEDQNGNNLTGSVSIPSAGGWQSWTSVVKTGVRLNAGDNVYKLIADAGNWNINFITAELTGP